MFKPNNIKNTEFPRGYNDAERTRSNGITKSAALAAVIAALGCLSPGLVPLARYLGLTKEERNAIKNYDNNRNNFSYDDRGQRDPRRKRF